MSFRYVPADEYLSGNIRKKLKTINKYINSVGRQLILLNQDTENEYTDRTIKEIEKLENEKLLLQYQKDKLKEVMPEDLKASEINVRLGATWIPEKDIEKFVFEKLETSWYLQHDIKVEHSEITGEWRIDGKSSDTGNTLSEVKYGTSRVNAYKIIENALNLRDTKVYDRVEDNDGKVRSVLNKKETMLANQRQDLINEEFKNWIFDDLDRRVKLEKIYNEKFNSIRNREYDGSNLKFDGMNPEINLRKHQRNAIARSLYGGNTLHAHVVGAGKTYTMIADAMESKRLGLASKSLFTVPNHITTQFGREFMQLYPGANILVANKKDFEPKNRKRFIGKIATGEYDAVILGHSQFEKIMMSKKYQTKHIQDQIDDIVESLEEINYMRGTSFTVKQMEKTKKQLETRLEKLNDDYMKDDVITFEELGVDKLFVDEAHNYKNLYLHTKMQNVAGVGQSKALKSSDMFMKCRYMDEITGGKGIVFATGTPVSNSMTELYTMQRYLQYDALKKNGLEYFDSWASTFGETVTAFELSPEGTKYRMKTRFSKFYNLPELMSMFKETADIQTANMLNLPVPKANYRVIKTEPTEEQKEILKEISNRADSIRNGSVPPEVDNMLKITNDGKKLALDQRLINPLLPDDPNSKLNVCMKNVFKIWEESKENSSAQLIFSDMSTPKSDTFNVYDDIKEKLIGLGVPEKEIAFIHDANTDKQKDELFNKVRKGDIRVLLGSTQKMGSGTNAQDKLIALHDLDVPWRPSDLEQRSGRIVRQGNKNKEVDIYRYVTTNTFDSYLWQTIENKQKFISQIMTSKTPVRVAEDVDESSLNYAEIKALATGNPLIKEKMELDNEVTKLKMMESNYKSSRYSLEDKVHKKYPRMIKQYTELINKIKKDIENVEPQNKDKDNRFTSLTVDGVKYEDKEEAGKKLMEAIKSVKVNQKKVIGSYRKMDIVVSYNYLNNEYEFTLLGEAKHSGYFGTNELGNIERMDNRLNKMDERTEETKNQLQRITENLKKAKLELDKPFEKEEELKEKTNRLAEINRQLEMADEDLELSESEQIEKLDVSFNNSTVIALENSFEI